MEATTTEKLQYGIKYPFKNVTIKSVKVTKNIDQYFIFHDTYIEWHSEYVGLYVEEEDEQGMGVKKDVERHHIWDHLIGRDKIMQLQIYKWFDENLWVVKIHMFGTDDQTFCFYIEDKARKMYEILKQYIFRT